MNRLINIQYERFNGLAYQLVFEDVPMNQLSAKITYLQAQVGTIRKVQVNA